MKIRQIIQKFIPAYNRYVERKIARTTPVSMEQKADEFVLQQTPELISRRKAVAHYLETGEHGSKTSTIDFEPNYADLSVIKFEEIIKDFGDDVALIRRFFGDYGLSVYAKMSPENVIKNRNSNITEIKIDVNEPFDKTVYKYLAQNCVGSLHELTKRFGESGAYIYDHCSRLGLSLTGIDAYKLSEKGKLFMHHNILETNRTKSSFDVSEMIH